MAWYVLCTGQVLRGAFGRSELKSRSRLQDWPVRSLPRTRPSSGNSITAGSSSLIPPPAGLALPVKGGLEREARPRDRDRASAEEMSSGEDGPSGRVSSANVLIRR
jgi:hypothetical protein